MPPRSKNGTFHRSWTGAKSIELAERRRKVWDLRRAHASYEQIAERLGIAPQMAFSDVKHVLNDFIASQHHTVGEWVEVEQRRLDALALALWPQVQKGDVEAVKTVVRIMERRARLLGLDAPQRHELTGAGGGPLQLQAALVELDASQLKARHDELIRELAAAGEVVATTPPSPEAAAEAYVRELAERGKNGNGNGNNGQGG